MSGLKLILQTCEYKYFLKLLEVTSVIKFNTLMLKHFVWKSEKNHSCTEFDNTCGNKCFESEAFAFQENPDSMKELGL